MTNKEKLIQKLPFNNLWNQMWSFNQWKQNIQEKNTSKNMKDLKKFNKLKNGMSLNNTLINFDLINSTIQIGQNKNGDFLKQKIKMKVY